MEKLQIDLIGQLPEELKDTEYIENQFKNSLCIFALIKLSKYTDIYNSEIEHLNKFKQYEQLLTGSNKKAYFEMIEESKDILLLLEKLEPEISEKLTLMNNLKHDKHKYLKELETCFDLWEKLIYFVSAMQSLLNSAFYSSTKNNSILSH